MHTKNLLFSLLFVLFAAIVWFLPVLNFKVGDVFFGGVPSLYNVQISEFFFRQAAFPLMRYPHPYAFHQLSRTHFIQGEFSDALTLAKREFEYFPEHWRTHYIIGLTEGYMGREIDAINSFQKFLDHEPKSWAARNDKAWLHFRIGDIKGGLETITPAAEQYPDNPWVMNTYGVLLMNEGKLLEAKVALEKASLAATALTSESWGKSYPGNSPEIYDDGLTAMRASIEKNLQNIQNRLSVLADDNSTM